MPELDINTAPLISFNFLTGSATERIKSPDLSLLKTLVLIPFKASSISGGAKLKLFIISFLYIERSIGLEINLYKKLIIFLTNSSSCSSTKWKLINYNFSCIGVCY